MKPIRVAHKSAECIGCALCTEVAPDYWQLDEDGIARLRQITRSAAPFDYTEAFPEDRPQLEAAATGCPVGIIRIEV